MVHVEFFWDMPLLAAGCWLHLDILGHQDWRKVGQHEHFLRKRKRKRKWKRKWKWKWKHTHMPYATPRIARLYFLDTCYYSTITALLLLTLTYCAYIHLLHLYTYTSILAGKQRKLTTCTTTTRSKLWGLGFGIWDLGFTSGSGSRVRSEVWGEVSDRQTDRQRTAFTAFGTAW
jgi:hypothetical protein